MKRFSLFFSLFVFSLALFGQVGSVRSFNFPAGISSKDYAPNTLIVKYKRGKSVSNTLSSIAEACPLQIKSASIEQIKPLFPGHRNYKTTRSAENTLSSDDRDGSGLDRIIEVKFVPSEGATLESIASEILKDPHVEYVDLKYIYHTSALPNDLSYIGGYQGYLSQVHAEDAWGVTIGAVSPTIIAIVDSGSQLNHEDLAANIAPGGYDLVGCCRDNPTPDNDPNVYSISATHGVHVSGLASAVTNNGIGIASIAYNTGRLLIVKVTGDDYPKDVVAGYEGIVYAVNHGAKIINCSWGGSYAGVYGQNIINYALSNDCLIIAAAGNNGTNVVDYPAAYAGVLGVASVSSSDQKSSFSQYGREVAISAPGGEIGVGILSTIFDNTYGYDIGTSMATPIVSSAAALVKAKNPSWTMQQVGEQLKATADDIDGINPGYAGLLGKGRLNVYRALTNAEPTVNPKSEVLELRQNYPNPSADNTYIDFTIPVSGLTSLGLYSIDGKLVKLFFNTVLNKGSYHTQVSLAGLIPGIYIYRVDNGDMWRSSKLIVGQ